MFLGSIGVWVAYTILISVGILGAVGKKSLAFRIIFVAVAVWYGVALYYMPPNFMGWPTPSIIPDDAKILSFRIREPSPNDEGGMFFWLNTNPDEKTEAYMSFRPQAAFLYPSKKDPRAYRIPYDRDLHKRLLEAKKGQQKMPGSWISIKKGTKGKKKKKGFGDEVQMEKMKFKIVNPIEILTKDSE